MELSLSLPAVAAPFLFFYALHFVNQRVNLLLCQKGTQALFCLVCGNVVGRVRTVNRTKFEVGFFMLSVKRTLFAADDLANAGTAIGNEFVWAEGG